MTILALEVASANSIRAVLLYGGVVAGTVATVFWRSEIGIYLLAVLLPLQTTRYHLHAFPLGANIVDILIFCVLLGSIIRSQQPLRQQSKVLGFLALLCGFYFLSLWRGAFFLGGSLPVWFSDSRLVDYKNFVVMPLLTLVVTRTIRNKQQIAIIILLTSITALAVDYSYLKSSAGRDFTHYAEETRDAGPLGYAGENGLASYLVEITAFLLPMLSLKGNIPVRASALVAVAGCVICILFSYSREAYLALAVVMCFLAVVRVRWLFVPILLLAFAWEAILPVAVQERVSMTYTTPHSAEAATFDASAQERLMLWTDAMVLFKNNPIIGTGFLTYAQMGRVGSYKDTHNFYLKMLVETGLLGLMLFLTQLMLFLKEGIHLFQRAEDSLLSLTGLGFASMIIAAAVVNVFGDRWTFIQVDSNLWILLGCVICASSMAAEATTSKRVAAGRRGRRSPWAQPDQPLVYGGAAR